MQDLVGMQIGRYNIIERLGMGGMAVVYKAYDTQLQRNVAIKIIRKETIASQHHSRLIERFKREARTMAAMTHPNIVQVFDYGEFNGAPYLVMAYLVGGTIKQFTGKPMNFRQAVSLVLPVADALAYAHGIGIIHRDIKPANILITNTGNVMLSDFGIAKLLEGADLTLTTEGMGVGTPQYMAPEQWRNEVCPQTDIYALGVVLYELITGIRPYDADTPAAVAVLQATEPLVQPSFLVPDLPAGVEKTLFIALSLKPEDRYPSMADFASTLRMILQGKLTEVPTLKPVSFSENPVDSEGTTIDQLQGASYPKETPQPSPVVEKSKRLWPYLVGGMVLLFLCVLLGIGLMQNTRIPIFETLAEKLSLSRSAPAEDQDSETTTIEESQEETTVSTELQEPETQAAAAGSTRQPMQFPNLFRDTPTATMTITLPTASFTPTDTETAPLEIGSSITREKDGMLMMYIPAGPFLMGSNDSIAKPQEKPQHEVTLDAYWMDAYEVTNAMFATFVSETGYLTHAEDLGYSYMYNASYQWKTFNGVNWRYPMSADTEAYDALPVVHVNFNDAAAYCAWAGGRLPTEAEWEKGARGTDGRTYPWGDTFNSSYLRYNSSDGPVSVYLYPEGRSPYELYHMAGNVFEWTQDWFDENYYSRSPLENPTGPSTGEWHVLRGGSWNSSQSSVRTTHRDVSGPEYMNYLLGFRCVMDSDQGN